MLFKNPRSRRRQAVRRPLVNWNRYPAVPSITSVSIVVKRVFCHDASFKAWSSQIVRHPQLRRRWFDWNGSWVFFGREFTTFEATH